jgi:hypothetical protein
MAKAVLRIDWAGIQSLPAEKFTCGFCDLLVASERGYPSNDNNVRLVVCPHCRRPTLFELGSQFPGVAYGGSIQKLPVDIAALYDEARVCCSSSAYTGAVLLLRKLLMNVAVDKGAAEGLRFIEYVEYLSSKGYVPPDGKGWVDHIRKKGNEATHEIKLMSQTDAEDLITFAQMLLKFIYEFPSMIASPPKP